MRLENGKLCLRALELESNDLDRIYRWLTGDAILTFFSGRDRIRSRADVQAEFAPNAYGGPLMIEYERQVIGFLDICPFTVEQKIRHGLADAPDPVWAFDIVIGEVALHNRGIGRQIIRMILPVLFDQFHAQRVVLDTYPWNARAIRCYEHCGFKVTRVLPQHELYEGSSVDAVLMEIDRAPFYA